ncbi:MAG: M48 family metalloprotease [Pseudomonadota bacterium]
MLSTKRFVLLLGAASLLAALVNCASNPATGKLDVVLMSESKEIEIGRKAHEELISDGATYNDTALQSYVNRIGQELAKNSARPDIEYTFTVVDEDSINAFALPGGYIYLYRGLLAYLDTEEEMAAVLAHEIGHVTARHAVRQKTSASTSEVLSTLAGVATGNADLYNASRQYATEIIRGYGREMELEADGEGAEYLHATGYDPNAMLDVINVLKDLETFQRDKALAAGQRVPKQSSLYATHPRNELRYQEVIRVTGELDATGILPVDPTAYREATQGLSYGKSSEPPEREDDRFYHNKLGFTFAIPDGWTAERGSRAIITSADDGSARLALGMSRAPKDGDYRSFLASAVGESALNQGKALEQAGLKGYTAIAPAGEGKSRRRVAVLQRGSIAYVFEGQVLDDGDFPKTDKELTALISSFRPMKPEERSAGPRQYIDWEQVKPGETLATIARGVRLPNAEKEIRLMNGYYPRGEPRAGDWIKVVKTET